MRYTLKCSLEHITTVSSVILNAYKAKYFDEYYKIVVYSKEVKKIIDCI